MVLFYGWTQARHNKNRVHITVEDKHIKLNDINEQRKLFNMYYSNYILPWFSGYIKPYKIIKKQFYIRQHMLYWGVVIKK